MLFVSSRHAEGRLRRCRIQPRDAPPVPIIDLSVCAPNLLPRKTPPNHKAKLPHRLMLQVLKLATNAIRHFAALRCASLRLAAILPA